MPSSLCQRKTKRLRKRRTFVLGRLAEAAYVAATRDALTNIHRELAAASIGMSSADGVKMTDNPVPETLETIAAKIDALSKSNDERFARVDQQFAETGSKIEALSKSNDRRFGTIDQRFAKVDQQFDETRAQIGVKIEAVETKVVQVYDAVIAMREETERNATEHKTFTKRLDNHDVRLLALEKPGTPQP